MDTALDPQISQYSRARKARDARFDGLFFVAVVSTGIYCRPVCPAPAALERNVRYFRHAAAAAAAGFRPCLRCRPELAPGLAPCDHGERVFELAWQRIRDGVLAERSLTELADALGVSERQLRRQFVDRIGVPPHAVHATQRLLLAKQLLTETALPVIDVAFASGFRSLRRFNQAFLDGCGMPPTRLRQRAPGVDTGRDLLSLKLSYRPPYAAAAVFGFLADRAVAGVERVEGRQYSRVFGTAQAPGWLSMQAIDGETAFRLQLRLPPSQLPQLPELIRRVRRMFDLDAQPDLIGETLGSDPLLAASLAHSPGLRVPGAFDGFETAVRAVLGQQVSVAAARTLCTRLVERWGDPIEIEGMGAARLFPRAEVLAQAPIQEIGLPAARAATIRSLAQAVAANRIDLEHMQALGPWREQLCALPGIGPWTAEYIAMRCLHHPDAFPSGDLVLRKQLGAGVALSAAATERRAEAWRPWRSYAVLHLWNQASASARASE